MGALEANVDDRNEGIVARDGKGSGRENTDCATEERDGGGVEKQKVEEGMLEESGLDGCK